MTASGSTLPPLPADAIEAGDAVLGMAAAEAISEADAGSQARAGAEAQVESQTHRKLESKAMTATVWTIASYGIAQGMRMVNNIALTRLLIPEYFGLMALMTTLVTGMRLLTDIGLQPGVIGSPRGDEPLFLDTAWTVQIVRGVLLWLVACVLTVPFAHFYSEPRLIVLLPVLALPIMIDGFQSTNMMTMARHLGLRRLMTIEFASQIFTIAVTITWAYFFRNIWALVAGTLAAVVFKTVVSHMPVVLPGHRNRLAWDKSAVHSLVHFSKWILLGTAFYFLATSADRLILGKLTTFTLLGVYSIAFTVADIPRQVILQFTDRVGLPFVAKMSHLPREEFRAKCLKYRLYVLVAGAFILSAVVNFGGLFVQIAYKGRYQEAVWMVPILALGLWHTLLYATTKEILVVLDKAKYNAVGTALFAIAMFATLPPAYHFFGMTGAVVSVAAGDLPLYIALGIGVAKQRVSMWRQDAMATAIFLAVLAAGFGLRHLVG